MYIPRVSTSATPARTARPSILAMLGLVVGIAVGGGITWLGGQAIANEIELRLSGVTTVATVTASRVMRSSRSGDSLEVRYAFSVPGGATVYHHEDETGRGNLWASLEDEAIYGAAVSGGHVDVLYLPRAPSVNRPLYPGAAGWGGDQLAGLGLGLCLLVPCLLLFLALGWQLARYATGR